MLQSLYTAGLKAFDLLDKVLLIRHQLGTLLLLLQLLATQTHIQLEESPSKQTHRLSLYPRVRPCVRFSQQLVAESPLSLNQNPRVGSGFKVRVQGTGYRVEGLVVSYLLS